MSEYTGKKIKSFRERFVELCESDPRTDTAIADALNVSRQTISSWKSGARSPKKPMVITIASEFNVDVGWLFGFDVPREPAKRETSIVPRLSPEDDEALGDLVDLITRIAPKNRELAKKILLNLIEDG